MIETSRCPAESNPRADRDRRFRLGDIEPGHFETFVLFQMLDGVQHRVMLGFVRDDVTAA